MTYIFVIAVALFCMGVMVALDKVGERGRMATEKFEPYEIGDMTVKKGDMLECTESYGEFTKGYSYVVRVEYGGALVVWNDETKPVLAAGLDPRKFKVVAENVDGTAAAQLKGGKNDETR